MNKLSGMALSLASALLLAVLPARMCWALNYGDFSTAMSGSFGSHSDIDIFLALLWLIALVLALLWAARLTARQRRRQIDEAYQRMIALRNRPRTISRSGVYIRPAGSGRSAGPNPQTGSGRSGVYGRPGGSAQSGQLSGKMPAPTRQVR